MSQLVRQYTTFIWLLLLALTSASWLLADDTEVREHAVAWLSTGLVALAFIKVRLVGLHFMELKHAPLSLRLVFEIWVIATCAGVVGTYWLTPAAI